MRNEVDRGGGLLAAVRRASHDDELFFDSPPRPANASGSVVFLEPRTPTGAFSGTAVLRMCPDPVVAEREVLVQRYLTASDYPAPAVLLTGSPADELGGTWLLTEHVSGRPVRIGGWRSPIAGIGSLFALWRRPALLADLSARLHGLDPTPLSSALGDAEAGLDWFDFQWDLAERLATPNSGRVLDWLRDNEPAESTIVVTHGDLHPGNIVIGPDGARVVDWSIAAVAPPARDVACTMFALLNTGGQAPAPLRPVFSRLGRLLSRRFLRRYNRRRSGVVSDRELEWHRVLYSVNRIFWITREEGRGPAANDGDDLAKRADRAAGPLGRELPLHVALIEELTGIDLGVDVAA